MEEFDKLMQTILSDGLAKIDSLSEEELYQWMSNT